MSLKLIFLPASLVFAIAIGIFWIYPEYQSIAAQKTGKVDILKSKEAELAQKQQMKSNGDKLVLQLNENKESVDHMLEVVPRSSEEEKGVAMVSRAVQASGLSLVDIGVTAGSQGESSPSAVSAEEPAVMMDATGDGSMMEEPVVAPVENIKARTVDVSFSVIGSYDGFKQFAMELEKAPRKNQITKLEIGKKVEEGQDLFEMSGTVSFEYAPISKVQSGVISSAFSQNSLDFSSLEGWQRESEYLAPGEALSVERSNPFLP